MELTKEHKNLYKRLHRYEMHITRRPATLKSQIRNANLNFCPIIFKLKIRYLIWLKLENQQ